MSGIIDCEMHIGDEVFVHGYIDEIRNDTIIIRNVGGYFGTSRDEVFYYEKDEPNSSEKPNNCEDLQDWKDRMWAEAIVTEPTSSKMEQVDKDINVRSKTEPTMRLHEWTSDDITFCTAKCEVKCFRKPKHIKHKDIPHSFADFSNSCVEYEPNDNQSEKE